jgi:putative ABC transport system ATP-binding protein
MLEIRNLGKRYLRSGEDRQLFWAVSGANMRIDAGDFISIVGESGSGKSTLLSLMAGLLLPDTGEIRWKGRPYSDMSDDALSLLRNTGIGYIPQGEGILHNFSVLENVKLPCFLHRRGRGGEEAGDAEARARFLLERTGIARLGNELPRNLSGGERRRVTIVRGLVMAPDLLIADEPTSDLDARTTMEVMELFRQISQNGTAVVMVTHEPDAASFGNRAFIMESGVLTEGSAMNPLSRA